MGASLSTSANGVLVALEQPTCHPGEVVQGVVCVNVVQPIQTTGIYLKLKGFERTHWTTSHSRQKAVQRQRLVTDSQGRGGYQSYTDYEPEYYTVDHSGRHELFRVQIPLGPAGCIPPGQYQFPFLFVLPTNLPASFYCRSGNKSGEIKYKIKAVVGVRGMLRANLRHTQQLHVAPHAEGTAPLACRASDEIMTCGCFASGHANAELSLSSGCCRAGNSVGARLQVVNHTKKPFKSVQVAVMQHVQLSSTDAFCKEGGNSTSFTDKVCNFNLPGWAAGEVECNREFAIPVPAGAGATCNGNLVQCSHWLEVKCSQGLLKTALRMRVPLTVQAPLVGPQWRACTLPNWRPAQAGEPKVAAIPGAPPLPSQYLRPERQFWRRLVPAPAPAPAAAAAGAPPSEGLWGTRSEPFPAAAQGACGAGWKPPMGTAHSAMGAACPACWSPLFLNTMLPIHTAAFKGHTAAATQLLAAAPHTSQCNSYAGLTPLRVAIGMQHKETTRCLLKAGPAAAALATLEAGGPLALDLFADFVAARCPLRKSRWRKIPHACPGMGKALPAAFAHSPEQARQVVRRLPAADAERLHTFTLCLARLQRRLGLPLSPDVCGGMLAAFDA